MNCSHVIPNLLAALKYAGIIPGRVLKALSRHESKEGVKSVEVKASNGNSVNILAEMVTPCLPPPSEPKWVVALADGRAPDDRVVRAGMIYKVMNFNSSLTQFIIVGERGSQETLGKDLVEPCHQPTIDTCSKVKCIDNHHYEHILTKGKVYNVLKRSEDGSFITVILDSGADRPAYNTKFFAPYLE